MFSVADGSTNVWVRQDDHTPTRICCKNNARINYLFIIIRYLRTRRVILKIKVLFQKVWIANIPEQSNAKLMGKLIMIQYEIDHELEMSLAVLDFTSHSRPSVYHA
jgi:hypothetical protein